MTFAEVLPALAAGRRVRRCDWAGRDGMASLLVIGAGAEAELRVSDLLASDWELVEEPAKPAMYDGRIQDVASEQFGPFPVQTDEEAMTCIERGIFALRVSVADAEGAVHRMRKEAAAKAATIARLERELGDQQVKYSAMVMDIDAKHGEQVQRLERELAEAKRGRTKQCRLPHPLGEAWVCTLPVEHQGSHANSFGSWR